MNRDVDYQLTIKILAGLSFIIFIVIYRQFVLMKYNKKLKELSVTDKLTGLYNRVKTDKSIQNQIELYQRYEASFCIMMLDLDFFKKINDTYGHQIGDNILVETASVLRGSLRKTDVICRWGGEEFLVILPNTGHLKTLEMADRVRMNIYGNKIISNYAVTISIGIAEITKEDDFNTLIKRADDALYNAKEKGRNRVEYLNI